AGCSNQRIEQALTGSMNKIATLFHPKIYGGTMLLTLNSSIEIYHQNCPYRIRQLYEMFNLSLM
ncbi:hypothetical protein, partial [Thiolapillus sp.]|uniref:hypothetical protein n=1 Tax=Thiolapillus sp. TaxID=2017437 RepID=UPI0025DF0F80